MTHTLLDPAEEGGAPLGEAELLRLAEALVPVFAGGGAAIGSITKFWLLLGADFLATTTGVAAGAATAHRFTFEFGAKKMKNEDNKSAFATLALL